MLSNSSAGPFFSSTRRAMAPISRFQSTSAVIRRSSPSFSSRAIHCRMSMNFIVCSPPTHALLKSICLRSRELHHLRPLLRFLCDQLFEFGRGAAEHRLAQIGKLRFQLRIGETRIDLPVELGHGLGARVLGSASERFAVVTASARSFPARIYSMAADIGVK